MRYNHTIANEVISINANRDLGPLIEKTVSKMTYSYRKLGTIPVELTNELRDIIQTVGFKTEVMIDPSPLPSAGCALESFDGNSSIEFNKTKADVIQHWIMSNINESLVVDLVKVKVSGTLTQKIYIRFIITEGLLSVQTGLSTSEITAVILHEIGHAFDTMMCLGQYAYYNFALSEGVDILLGNKLNKHKLQVLDIEWIKKNVQKEDYQAFVEAPTPANATRVILGGLTKDVRGYLYANSAGSWKRNEQLADQFATRLGYGRELISANYKLDHMGMTSKEYRRYKTILNAVSIGSMLIGFPIVIGYLIMESDAGTSGDTYDNPIDRVKRIRMDMVAQLKNITDPVRKASIAADIAAADAMISSYMAEPGLFQRLADWVKPYRRQALANMKHEQNLEQLLNNQLFVTAYQFNPKV